MKKLILCIVLTVLLITPAWSQMWQIGEMPIPGFDNGRLLRSYGDYCFISKYASQLIVADLFYQENPVTVDVLYQTNHGYITIAENTLYLAGGSFTSSVLIIDITDPENISLVGSTPTSANSCDLEARGNYLYVCGYGNGLVIYDITERYFPIEVSRITGIGNVYGIKLSENYMYLASASQGLRIYEISDPGNPQFLSFLSIPSGGYPLLTKDNDYVYYASYSYGHVIIDVSNPANPFVVTTVNPSSVDQQIEVANDRMFCGNLGGGLLMYNILNPAHPSLMCTIPTPGWAWQVQAIGSFLHLADLSYFRVMGYSKPADGYYHEGYTTFNWIDITLIGDLWALGDDTFTPNIEIGFDFPFYDNIYDELYVCSNGFIAFNDYSPSYWDTPIPCDTQPNDIIAPFWDNFNPTGSPYNVYTALLDNPQRFVVEFVDMPRVGAVNEFETFEVLLYPNGDIIFQYPEVVNATSATVGIENETGTRGTQLAHNIARPVPDSTAVGFQRIGNFFTDSGVEWFDEFSEAPFDFNLVASPNPFNPNTTVSYQLPKAGIVTISAYNVLGRREAVLVDEHRNAGSHSVEWNASNLPSGIYFVVIQANGNRQTLRTLLMK